jgi:hypothetical protein
MQCSWAFVAIQYAGCSELHNHPGDIGGGVLALTTVMRHCLLMRLVVLFACVSFKQPDVELCSYMLVEVTCDMCLLPKGA